MSIESVEDSSLFGKPSVDPEGVVGKAAASAHDTVDKAAQRAQSAFDCAHDYIDQAVEAPRNVIRDNPVASVVLALAVGFLWGRLGASRD
ncbi:hypothetical protein GT347_04315 [Xylophilus rhododendri]|uniref:DUF883 domain-containing protein n=1 Tax=Xylophilus rhododendri TaxID=2697032 RepID=A0A857J2H8_9BURK|nr:hypothetical protein [Xylophilus rhododendri]QHI97272.1 hypothetical protein GT347_04315 [Xylophilus rhododendri]